MISRKVLLWIGLWLDDRRWGYAQRVYQRVYETKASYVSHMRWDSKEEKDERMNIGEKEYDILFLLDCGWGLSGRMCWSWLRGEICNLLGKM